MNDPFRHPAVTELVRLAVEEDVGRGDVTTAATVSQALQVHATIRSREAAVVAGMPIAAMVLEQIGGAPVAIEIDVAEGTSVNAGATLCRLRGDARMLLAAERTILNFQQRLCGVATLTRRFVDAVAGTGAQIVDTRKTLPGWRQLDKYAVRMGGGRNHRFGLDDGILIKDNHILACGGIAAALERARGAGHHLLRIEVECESLAEVEEALAAGADAILLDNMKTADVAEAVKRIGGRALVEASGGMSLERVREVAVTGVNLISVGALTHSAPAIDLTMEIDAATR